MKLIILITGQTDQSLEIATRWQQAGATGVTIVEGHGLRRLQEIRDDLPLIPSLSALLRGQEVSTHILISAVPDNLESRLYQETEAILGDLTQPDNGLILTLDIANILGLRQT
ncbi:MAG: hypothetical protein H7Y09_02810 [Chitinophagaceae bacterium]|nr:hypothetical protein [Anaerolineae bacterium]